MQTILGESLQINMFFHTEPPNNEPQPIIMQSSSSYDSFRSVDPSHEEVLDSNLNADVEIGTNENSNIDHTLTDFPFNVAQDKSPGKDSTVELGYTLSLHDIPYSCFTKWQVFTIFFIVIFIGFLGPMSGNIYIPALPLLQEEFKVSTTVINSTVSVFMGVFAIGPLFWGAFADLGGRKILYMISILIMVIVNILLASMPTNIVSLYILRVAQAFGSSSVMSLGAGTVTDLTKPTHRGKAIAYFMLGPNLGPIVAPIIAGLILMHGEHWRWLFGFTAIMAGTALIMVIVVLPETLRCKVGNGDPGWKDFRGINDIQSGDDANPAVNPQKKKWRFFADIGKFKPVSNCVDFKELYPSPPRFNLKLYWKLLLVLPVSLTSIATALLFANYYAFSVTLSHYLKDNYNMTILQIGACYVCPGVSMVLGSQIGGHLSDHLRNRWLRKHEGKQYPLELRLVLQIPGILINTLGCIGYGWAIQKHYPLAVVLVFSGLNAFGLTWCSNTTMTYLTELLSRRAAGAVALSSLFRNIAATISSALIIKFTQLIGIGMSFTVLGLCNIISLVFNCYIIRYSGIWQNKVKHI
ncbi:similar to Saccharomyces cerevisiae YBR180W DTR1 Putative dityrosine transporter, required for spore wall synthesis [Maudiozyma saulgeensis]|uniref:Similar to Saccharomyces cerevisiae YBR180W DTR1 Putative dityrosine transporter, required for spore wall synthesis n=1 Tax=Maudiozyma saulgeensis TaxID=1789683 RepID=A0A1X7R2B9_9SACH|nr:similar to Saccharomyces cerevisiae YBR180W DTR1 Putative dityrosine transporter, required for spore wall synthesis [Kazachstania saulgeensis]